MKIVQIRDWGEPYDKNYTGIAVWEDGTKIWYKNGKYHRLDGPAVIRHVSGEEVWYKNGKLHRINGPSYKRKDGRKEWHINDKLHRLDGPAIITKDGKVEYWINNEQVSKEAAELYGMAFPEERDQK
jgi:hypothetical protein